MFAAMFVFAAIFAVSSFGQVVPAAGTQANVPFKMAVIDTGAFDGKDGITRFTAAMGTLETEFKPVQTEIQGLITKYQNLGAEIEKMRTAAAQPNNPVPISPQAAQAKLTEYQDLETQIKRKQEDAKARLDRRQPQVLGPIQQEIGRALQDYAKQKGYALILDAQKLDQNGFILAFDAARVDVTRDFITFFNTRPATTASTAAPK